MTDHRPTIDATEAGEAISTYPAADGYSIKYRLYRPDGPPKALVVVIHGIQSHSGWYAGSCRFLAGRGYRVAALDRRGSGMNDADCGHAPSYKVLLDDIDRGIEHARADAPELPVHLIGISWGAKTAAAFACTHREAVRSVVFSGPGFFPVADLPLADKLAVALGALLRPRRTLPIPLGDGAMFTSNPERIRYINTDPLTLREATLRLYFESRRLDVFLRRRLRRLPVPWCLMIGTEDRIINTSETLKFFTALATQNDRIATYNYAAHTLEFEADVSSYFADLASWLDENSGG